MRKSLFLSMLIFSFLLCGFHHKKEKIEVEDFAKAIKKKGLWYLKNSAQPYTGTLFSRFPNSKLKTKINFRNGQRHGVAVDWYKSGRKMGEYQYKDGRHHGHAQSWHPNGVIKEEICHVNGKLSGTYKLFRSDRSLAFEGKYFEGLYLKNGSAFTGKRVIKYKNGRFWKETGFFNGLVHGFYGVWDKEGKPVSGLKFINGKTQPGNFIQIMKSR
ncbi:toxin-antitoxin system YwqK family antitoxin [Candidatus Riflebacteria bacterium]